MSKGLEALKTIRYIHDTECGEDKSINREFEIIEKELESLEELKIMYSNCVIEGAKQKEILEFIKNNISYTRALYDRTKNPDNYLICFDIRGLVNEETWRKIYEAIGTPII